MDIEGAEMFAIEGMKEILDKKKSMYLFTEFFALCN